MLSAKEEDIKDCDALLESEMQNLKKTLARLCLCGAKVFFILLFLRHLVKESYIIDCQPHCRMTGFRRLADGNQHNRNVMF